MNHTPGSPAQQNHFNYVLKIDLQPSEITNPPISRTISCPVQVSLEVLHRAIQIAFGWSGGKSEHERRGGLNEAWNGSGYTWKFESVGHEKGGGGREEKGMGKEEEGGDMSTHPQEEDTLMSGTAAHRSTTEDVMTLDPQSLSVLTTKLDNTQISLSEIVSSTASRNNDPILNYAYQHPYENWKHTITLLSNTSPHTTQIICLSGSGHACTEGVGGPSGWLSLLAAYDARMPNREQKGLIVQYENELEHGDLAGLRGQRREMWDIEGINTALREMDPGLEPDGSDEETKKEKKKKVLLISLDKGSYFNVDHDALLTQLNGRVQTVIRAENVPTIRRYLWSSNHHGGIGAVIVTDAEVLEDEHEAVQKKLAQYARAGGLVLFAFVDAENMDVDVVDECFQSIWGLQWRVGGRQQRRRGARKEDEVFVLNPLLDTAWRGRFTNFHEKIALQGFCLVGAKVEDRIYVLKAEDGGDESPVVLGKYGMGRVGWITGLDTRNGMMDLLLSMCA